MPRDSIDRDEEQTLAHLRYAIEGSVQQCVAGLIARQLERLADLLWYVVAAEVQDVRDILDENRDRLDSLDDIRGSARTALLADRSDRLRRRRLWSAAWSVRCGRTPGREDRPQGHRRPRRQVTQGRGHRRSPRHSVQPCLSAPPTSPQRTHRGIEVEGVGLCRIGVALDVRLETEAAGGEPE